jgi:hypothetical protein
MARPQRYNQILEIIEEVKPKSIVEVGVFNGERATLMAQAALKHSDAVSYIGYDLFEEATAETNSVEMNAKTNYSLNAVQNRLEKFRQSLPKNKTFSFSLVKGNTRETLGGKEVVADFAYIDGGHTVETINSDYNACSLCPTVVFDDYYKSKRFDLEKVGCNKLIANLEGAKILPSTDPLSFEGVRDGTVHLVRVDRQFDIERAVEDKLFDEVHEELERAESNGTGPFGDDQDSERQGSEVGGHERESDGEEQDPGGEVEASGAEAAGRSDGEEPGDQPAKS